MRLVKTDGKRPTAMSVRRDALERLLSRLEIWLPREAQSLTRLQTAGRPDGQREAEWKVSLQAYERLSELLSFRRAAA